jgi:hypothetical protein
MNRTSAMNEELSFTNVFCAECEILRDQCQRALSAWRDRSESAREAQLTGEAVGRELLRLQARFAKCYAVLEKHTYTCARCVSASEMNRFKAQLSPLSVC